MKSNENFCIIISRFNYFQDVRILTMTKSAQALQDMGQC